MTEILNEKKRQLTSVSKDNSNDISEIIEELKSSIDYISKIEVSKNSKKTDQLNGIKLEKFKNQLESFENQRIKIGIFSKTVNKELKIDYLKDNLNVDFIFKTGAETELDGSFIITNNELVQLLNLKETEYSDIFLVKDKKSENIFQPKLVHVNIFTKKDNATMKNYQENREEFKNHFIKSLSIVSKKNIHDENLRIKVDKSTEKTQYRQEEAHFVFKNGEYQEIISRIDSLLIFPNESTPKEDTIKNFQEIINEIKNFKRSKLHQLILFELTQINTSLIASYISIMIKNKNGKP